MICFVLVRIGGVVARAMALLLSLKTWSGSNIEQSTFGVPDLKPSA